MNTDAPTPSPPVVVLTDVVAVLGDFPALAGASLVVERGEIVLLRGPNGAGKTTLLRLCAGLVPLTRGSGSVAGHDLTSTAKPCGAGSACSATRTGCTGTSACGRT